MDFFLNIFSSFFRKFPPKISIQFDNIAAEKTRKIVKNWNFGFEKWNRWRWRYFLITRSCGVVFQTWIWILDFMSVNLDLLPWVFIFGPLLIGWTFGPLLTDLDLWMCHFGPEYLDLFRPLLFIMKGEFSCWKNRNELKKMKILLNNAKYIKVNDDKVDVNDKEQNGRLLTLILCILLIICCSSWTITVYIAAKAPNDTLW